MSAGQWVDWPGSPCPVPPETLVEIRTLNGRTGLFTAGVAPCTLTGGPTSTEPVGSPPIVCSRLMDRWMIYPGSQRAGRLHEDH